MQPTVEWLVCQKKLSGITCLAGHAGISNQISSINIMDNPDTVPWLKSGELVLSTGYLFSSTDIYKHIIKDLHEQGCSGLGIKLNRYIDALPAEMVEQAEKYNFPIVSIPFSSTMEQIVNLVYRQKFEDNMSENERIMSIYRSVAEAALKKQNLLPILKCISQAFETPVFMTTPAFDIIEYYIPKESDITFPFPYSEDVNSLFGSEDILRLQKENDENPLPFITHTVSYDSGEDTFTLFAIHHKKARLGYLACLTKESFSSFEYNLLTNLQSILGMALMSNSMLLEERRSGKITFFNKLLSGELTTEQQIEPLCNQYGFQYLLPRTCLLLQPANYTDLSVAKRRDFEQSLLQQVSPILSEKGVEFTHTIHDGIFVFFLFMDKIPVNSRPSAVNEYVNLIYSKLSSEGFSISVSAGPILSGATTIYDSYAKSLRAMELGRKLHPETNAYSYYQDQIYHIIFNSFTHADMLSIYDDTLKCLADYDAENDSELLSTLHAYIKCSKNITQTAKALFIHRNTMIYRLEQISEITGYDLKNPDTVFMLQASFYIKKLL